MMRWVAVAMLGGSLLWAAPALAGGPDTFDGTKLHATVPHTFTRAVAHARVQQLLDYWHQRFGVQSEWSGDRVRIDGTIWGIQFQAIFQVLDGVVSAEATDPGPLWRRSAIDYAEKKLRKYLHPKYLEP